MMSNQDKNIEIHETAFVTSTFRASNESLSQDHFAKLWSNTKTEQWIEDYLKQVSSEETHTHCLRNRYFLDTLKDLIDKNEIGVLINFGAGFSMYPFLLDQKIIHIEIDKPAIVNYKKTKLTHWQETGILPQRNIHLIGVDFSEDYKKDLLRQIETIKKDQSCFILIEGVLFFLDRKETDQLFDFFALLQNKGDYVGSASFQDALKDTVAFDRLLEFFGQKVSNTKESDYQTIEDDYYRSKPSYQLIDHQDYFSLSKNYHNLVQLERDLILNEHFYLLQKLV